MAVSQQNPTERVEATTTPKGAKGWADRDGSAQFPAGGHGLNVAPNASLEGIRAEARRREHEGNGDEPSNVPTADESSVSVSEVVAVPICSFVGCGRPAKGPGCARGFCNNHYVQWHKKHRHEIVKPRPKKNVGPCSVEGCVRDCRTRGMCQMHYLRKLYKGDVGPPEPIYVMLRGVPAAERFWARVDKTSTCWLWNGPLSRKGYGAIGLNEKRIPAHRFSYELLVGPIPEGYVVDHLCRVRHCVNPRHLEPVTPVENTRRGMEDRACTCGMAHRRIEERIRMAS